MKTVILLDTIHESAREVFEATGEYNVISVPPSVFQGALPEELRGAVALGVRSGNHISTELVESAQSLLAVGAFCIGTKKIDLAACSKSGVAVFNAPYSNTHSVVELTLAYILSLSRQLGDHNMRMHEGMWRKSAHGAHEVRGKTLGIIGYGGIGSQLSTIAENLGMQVCFYDVIEKLPYGNAHQCNTMEELLRKSDFVSVHVDTERKVIGAPEFALMKRGAYFINTSRGSVVDEQALAQAVRSGKLAGAAVDVIENEPKTSSGTFTSSLLLLDNVILSPHIGGSTEEAQKDTGVFVAEKIRSFIESGATSLSVNLPKVTMLKHLTGTRITYFHKNVPGAYAKFTTMFGDAGINIDAASNLDTRGEFGYVMVDVSSPPTPTFIQKLESLPEAIRVRVIRR